MKLHIISLFFVVCRIKPCLLLKVEDFFSFTLQQRFLFLSVALCLREIDRGDLVCVLGGWWSEHLLKLLLCYPLENKWALNQFFFLPHTTTPIVQEIFYCKVLKVINL